MLFSDPSHITVALMYQSPALHEHLRTALGEAGVRIVYESAIDFFSSEDLNASGASVIIINLDPEYGKGDDRIEELLLSDSRKVIFNDGEVTSKLSGWDQARWARHLAAKIIDSHDLLPTRPLGAESIPVRNLPEADPHSLIKPYAIVGASTHSTSKILPVFEVDDSIKNKIEAKPLEANREATTADSLEISNAEKPQLPVDAHKNGSLKPYREDIAINLGIDFDFHQSDETGDKTQPVTTPSAVEIMELDAFLAQHAINKNEKLAEVSSAKLEQVSSLTLDELMPELSFGDLVDAELTNILPAVTAVSALENTIHINELSLVSLEENNENQEKIVITESGSLAAQFAELSFELEAMSNENIEEFPAIAHKAPERNYPPAAAQQFAVSPTALENAMDVDIAALEVMTPSNVKRSVPENPTTGLLKASASYSQNIQTLAPGSIQRIWVLAASIGGPDAVREFLSAIPESSPNLFLLAQHMGADFVDLMIDQLVKATHLKVTMAANENKATHGQVLVVPLRERLLLEPNGQTSVVALDEVSPYSPSIDRVLFDVADRFGSRASAIIFSGMANDAIEGAKYLASKGGSIWAQDPDTCVVSSMIDGAIEAGVVSFVGSPSALAQKFMADFQ